jgi:hypothetical protein
LYDKRGKELSKIEGMLQGEAPIREVPQKTGELPSYPSYEIVTAGGITEIIEHKQMGPVFYINDDPSIRVKLLGSR